MEKTLYLGFDVHKDSIVIAYAQSGGGDPKLYGKCAGSNLAVERALNRICKKFAVEKGQIRIAYEAGSTGFVLVRRLLQLGYDAIVITPPRWNALPESGSKPTSAMPSRLHGSCAVSRSRASTFRTP